MIEFTKAYVSVGKTFATIEEAQIEELQSLLLCEQERNNPSSDPDSTHLIARIVEFRAEVIDILTTNGKSRPSARKSNGGTKRRKKAEPQAPAAAQQHPNLV